MGQEKAATPVVSVREFVKSQRGSGSAHPNNVWYYELGQRHALIALGIDPEMSIETLKARLRSGKRVDDLLANGRDRLEENEWGLACAISYLHDNSWGFHSTPENTDPPGSP